MGDAPKNACDFDFDSYRDDFAAGFAPSKPRGKVDDLLIFKSDVWYKTCKR